MRIANVFEGIDLHRRLLLITALIAAAAGCSSAPESAPAGAKYAASRESITTSAAPQWFDDAKLGIFIHWGLYSVPAWAPPSGELQLDNEDPNWWREWFAKNPYAEWYLNTIRIEGSPSHQHHVETYGAEADYYETFVPIFNREIEKWDPLQWAALFRSVNARYVVLTTKHHDGFTLWPSKTPHPYLQPEHRAAGRDIVGELADAVRAEGLRMGLYYSGGLDWGFASEPIVEREHVTGSAPQNAEYGAFADAHWRELIANYKPDVLWNDITYPKSGQPLDLFAEYLNTVPDGAINNRWGLDWHHFTTPEYQALSEISEEKWEACRGLGYSFGYNRVEGGEHVLSSNELVDLLIDIVSKNGNLLINVGPTAAGEIPEIQVSRLRALGQWLDVNGEAIFDTRPWKRAEGKTAAGADIRFTSSGATVYAILLDKPESSKVVIESFALPAGAAVELLGHDGELEAAADGANLSVTLPPLPEAHAYALKIG